MLTQSEFQKQIAARSGLARTQVKQVMQALEEVALEQLANARKVKLGRLVQLDVRLRGATKPRQGRNPATGETITIAAKPASVQLKARPLAKAKQALPSVQKAKKKLAA
jgi:DNA-binding protein HU-beta